MFFSAIFVIISFFMSWLLLVLIVYNIVKGSGLLTKRIDINKWSLSIRLGILNTGFHLQYVVRLWHGSELTQGHHQFPLFSAFLKTFFQYIRDNISLVGKQMCSTIVFITCYHWICLSFRFFSTILASLFISDFIRLNMISFGLGAIVYFSRRSAVLITN